MQLTLIRSTLATAAIAVAAVMLAAPGYAGTVAIAKIENFEDFAKFTVGETVDSTAESTTTVRQGFDIIDPVVTPDPYITMEITKVKNGAISDVDGTEGPEIVAGILSIFLDGTSPFVNAESLVVKASTETTDPFFFTAILGESRAYTASFNVLDLANPGGQIPGISNIEIMGSVVPLPAAAWLFLSGLAGLFGLRRLRRPA